MEQPDGSDAIPPPATVAVKLSAERLARPAVALDVSCAALLVAACHMIALRTIGPVTLGLRIGTPGDLVSPLRATTAPRVADDDTCGHLAQAVQRDLDTIPLRRDLAAGLLFAIRRRGDAALPGLRLEVLLHEQLLLTIEEAGGAFTLHLPTDRTLGGLPLAETYPDLLDLLSDRMAEPITRLPLLAGPAARRQIDALNDTARPLEADADLAALLDRRVRAQPERVAIEDSQFFLTAAQLDGEIARLHALFIAQGIGPGCLVGVAVRRSWLLPATIFALGRCGAPFVPFDEGTSAAWIAAAVRECGLACMIADGVTAPALPELPVPMLLLDRPEAPPITLADRGAPDPDPGRDPFCLMYAADPAGQPRGVAITRNGMLNLVLAAAGAIGFTEADRMLGVSPADTLAGLLDLLLPLLLGGTAVLSQHVPPDGAVLGRWLQASHATCCQATPALWRQAVAAGWVGGGLRILVAGLPDTTLARALAARGDGRAWHFHGAPETTGWSLIGVTDADTLDDAPLPPIGRPLTNTQAYVLDADGRLVAPGVAGELWIGGAGVAAGYPHRPDEAAAAFRPNPFTDRPGARLFRTGDRARLRPDGQLSLEGRVAAARRDTLRLDPAHIAAVLLAHPALRQAEVLADPGVASGPTLTAYVVPGPDRPDPAALRAHAAAHLPPPLVPDRFVLLPDLPLTRDGLIDHARLPADAAALPDAEPDSPARRDTEGKLIQLWEQVLRRGGLDRHADFFALGGDAALLRTLMDGIEHFLDLRLPANTLPFQGATPQAVAALLDRQPWLDVPYLVPLQPEGDAPPLYCAHTLGEPGLAAYRPLAERLAGRIPMIGLLARGVEDGGPAATTIPALAEHCVTQLQAHQPAGPYRLCGFGTGGLVAFEIAGQLRRAGHAVGLLLLDSEAARPRRPAALRRALPRLRARRTKQDRAAEGAGVPIPLRLRHALARLRHHPRPYADPVLLIASAETAAMFDGPGLGWDGVAPALQVQTVLAEQSRVLTAPLVEAVAAYLLPDYQST